MRRRATAAAVAIAIAGTGSLAFGQDIRMLEAEGEGAKYWPRWRGPTGQGEVRTGTYPDRWSPTEGIKWKIAVPGRGNSSPIVWGDRIFLTTAYDGGRRLALLAFRRADGSRLWETAVPKQQGVEYGHGKNGFASATPITDGERVYASFGMHGIMATDLEGRLLWHAPVGELSNYHGTAGSPVLYRDSIIVFHDAGYRTSFVGAFDKRTGKALWRTPRNESIGWGSPIVIRAGTRDELIVSSENRVYSYDPATGKPLWVVNGNTWEVVPTPIVGHNLLFCSSGRQGPTIAIRPGGSGDVTRTHVAWTSPRGSPFVPSAVMVGEVIYLVNDMTSIVTALEAKSGKSLFQGRLGRARREGFTASPVAVNGKVYFTNDEGETYVIEAGTTFNLLHVNQLGETTYASPALVDGVWYFRTQTSLVAIGA
jgi:outer membrane protein assembly factor BamB